MTPPDETRQLSSARDQVVREFADRLPDAEVARVFDEVVAGFEDAPVRTYVGLLAQRSAREILRGRLTSA